MEKELRDRLATYLAAHGVGVLAVAGAGQAWAHAVRYRSRGLEVDCLLPRWADVAYFLERQPEVLLVVESVQAAGHWLHYRGTARPLEAPEWDRLLPAHTRLSGVRPDELYQVVRLTPERLDLVDEGAGWGRRENLDL